MTEVHLINTEGPDKQWVPQDSPEKLVDIPWIRSQLSGALQGHDLGDIDDTLLEELGLMNP